MTFSSSLSDDFATFVIDTSVLINLASCKRGKEILQVIDNPFVLAEEAANEIRFGNGSRIEPVKSFLQDVLDTNLVRIATLSIEERIVYDRITGMYLNLDDGESATIAVAKCRNFTPIIDEKIGRRVAINEFGDGRVMASLDVLAHPKVESHFEHIDFRNLIYLALNVGRMNVLPLHRDYIIELIGIELALKCPSLPNFKALIREWKEDGKKL